MEKHYCSWSRLQYVNSGITIFLQNTPHKHFFTCIIQQWLCLIWQLLPSFSQTQSVFGCITETSTELFPPPDTKSGLSRGALSSAETLITALCISTLWLSLLPTERDCSAKPGSTSCKRHGVSHIPNLQGLTQRKIHFIDFPEHKTHFHSPR